ncbi:MAG: SET domain-containing protein [Candidatus Paceibacterota bacterium]|jgi:SET domain-containing protein
MKYSHSWLTKKAHKKKVPHGFGIFATKNIKKGERVIVFGGYVMNNKQFNSLNEKLKSYPFQIDDDLYFGLSNISEVEEADYLNHSCDANCGFNGEITIVAMRDIKKGEEITIDYAMCISSKDVIPLVGDTDIVKCTCGSKFCRKLITPNDWKRKDLQKRYKGFFEPFLEKKLKV